jgi:hypothetical protein
MNNFDKRLPEGERIEQLALERIRKYYPKAYKKEGNFSDYDIYIPEKDLKIEVKSCPLYIKPNYTNIIIEFEMNGKQTALCVSKADYWLIWDGTKFHSLKKGDILHCIFVNLDKIKYWDGAMDGDSSAKKAWLIPPNLLFNYGKEFI